MPNDRTPTETSEHEPTTAGMPLAGLEVLTLVDSQLPALGKTLADLGADIAAAIESSLVRVRQSPPPDEAAMFAHVDPTIALAPAYASRQENP